METLATQAINESIFRGCMVCEKFWIWLVQLIDWLVKAFTILFYVLSHRPLDLDNIYNQDQVKLLMKEGEHLTIPDFDDIYVDSEVTFFFLSLGPI